MTHGMSTTTLDLEPAARQLKTLLSGVTDDQLTARTPCEAYTVGDLLDHLMGLTIAFTMAATKSTGTAGSEDAPPPGPGGHQQPIWTPIGAGDCRCSSTSWSPPGRTRRPGQRPPKPAA
jgi:hypothetical protein